MSPQWYYIPDLSNDEILIAQEEAHHLVHVVRAEKGDELIFTDGTGTVVTGIMQDLSPKNCRAIVTSRLEVNPPVHKLHLAFAPAKNIDRTEWMLEKATEMGVNEFTPLRCKHSERKEINHDRLRKILIAASKQSKRAWFPKLNPVTTFSDFIASTESNSFLAHCNSKYSRSGWKELTAAGFPVTIMIGPEGDFSVEEIEAAYASGISGLTLGNRRLRTETAAMAVCFPLLLQNEEDVEIT